MVLKQEKKSMDWGLVAIFFGLLVIGLVVLASASSVVAYANYGDSYYFLKHQLLYGVLPGLAAFFILSKISYKKWQQYASFVFIFSLLLLFLVLLPNVGQTYNNARSWLAVADFSFQPSELAKLAFLVFLASLLSKKGEHIKSLTSGFLPFVFWLAVVASLIALQPDLGTMSVVVVMAMVVYLVAGAHLFHFLSLCALGAVALLGLIKLAPYRMQRLVVFLNPEVDPQGIGYHINQALLAIGSGGLFGLGLGHSRQKFQYLPEVYADSIFAIVAEELGFVFSLLIVILFLILILKTLKIAGQQTDGFARLYAVGFAAWVGGQAMFNIGAMIGLLPLTGVPLPLISYGGTAMLAVLAGFGILVNISKEGRG